MIYYKDEFLLIRSMEMGDSKIMYETYLSYGWHPSLEVYENYYISNCYMPWCRMFEVALEIEKK